MQPRFGRGLTVSLLRPLAEQLLAALQVPTGATVCELICDAGHLSRELARVIGPGGTLILTETDPELLDACAAQTNGLCTVLTRAIDGGTLDVDGESCDRVASLATLGGTDATSLLREARRVLRPGGTAACIVWDAGALPPHEVALSIALHEEAGLESRFLHGLLAPVRAPEWFSETELRDVARFDGFSQLWLAMIDERPLASELRSLSQERRDAVRRHCEALLAGHAAADGTMRIPVAARLLVSAGV